MSVVSPIIVNEKKDKLMRKPRMTVAEKRFVELLSKFLFVVPIGNGRHKIADDRWEMLNAETQDTYLTLLVSKTR